MPYKDPERNKERARNYRRDNWEAILARKYGLEYGQYSKMLEQQDNRCAICRNRTVKQRLAVDHSHITGLPRGALLCRRCNQALGLFEAEPIKIYNLIRYLENILKDDFGWE